ncbi:universal stress protein, partial [Mesorhizobium sp. M2D.F.Ca.ET.145.01.1.1]
MTFRTLLTVTGPNQGEGDLKLAASLCEQVGAHLSVLVLELAAPPSGGEYAAVVSPAWLEERQAELKRLEKRISDVAGFLSQTAVSADLSDDYPDTGWADDVIGRRARYADLTILGPDLLAS